MTHNDIFTKFMIDYDKANITSSYPSLTKYEAAVILDKAYNALIAQKVTGNNARKVQAEQDIKSISDLQNLICTETLESPTQYSKNVVCVSLPRDFLYYMSAVCNIESTTQYVELVSHLTAQRFIISKTNMPWIPNPVAYIEGGNMYIIYDYPDDKPSSVGITYIKQP